jgi:hypothetical protein
MVTITFSETPVQASATRYEVQEDIFNRRCRETIPEYSGLPALLTN